MGRLLNEALERVQEATGTKISGKWSETVPVSADGDDKCSLKLSGETEDGKTIWASAQMRARAAKTRQVEESVTREAGKHTRRQEVSAIQSLVLMPADSGAGTAFDALQQQRENSTAVVRTEPETVEAAE